MSSNPEILAEHYQKTFELTLITWEKRNQTFLLLLAVVGVATLLTFKVTQTQVEPLLANLLAKLLDIQDSTQKVELRNSFPYGLLQSILLMVVSYLTIILYHRTATIQRFYKYLAYLEVEIRDQLSLTPDSKSFTRESSFYNAYKPILGKFVATAFIGMLGLFLFAFLGVRIYSDFINGNYGTGIIDVFLSVPTVSFFYAYARISCM